MGSLFLDAIVAGLVLGLLLMNKPCGVQETSLIVATPFEVFFPFAATGRDRRFLFTCPAVRPRIPRLVWRHLVFLVALFVLQTAALAARPHLPDWWNTPGGKGLSSFDEVLLLLSCGLGWTQKSLTRARLERALREFSS